MTRSAGRYWVLRKYAHLHRSDRPNLAYRGDCRRILPMHLHCWERRSRARNRHFRHSWRKQSSHKLHRDLVWRCIRRFLPLHWRNRSRRRNLPRGPWLAFGMVHLPSLLCFDKLHWCIQRYRCMRKVVCRNVHPDVGARGTRRNYPCPDRRCTRHFRIARRLRTQRRPRDSCWKECRRLNYTPEAGTRWRLKKCPMRARNARSICVSCLRLQKRSHRRCSWMPPENRDTEGHRSFATCLCLTPSVCGC